MPAKKTEVVETVEVVEAPEVVEVVEEAPLEAPAAKTEATADEKPAKKTAAKKPATKKPAAKKPAATKDADDKEAKKPAAKKPAAKKPAAKKAVAKEADDQKAAPKKAPAKKAAPKKAPAKKPAAKSGVRKVEDLPVKKASVKKRIVKKNLVEVPKSEVSYQATGRRKDAVARVRLIPGTGRVFCNDRDAAEYFGRQQHVDFALVPLKAVGQDATFDVIAIMHGGGVGGQAGALRLGIARALLEVNPDFRAELKKAGLLKRDPRVVERKKYGLKKARKRPQFSKR